MSTVTHLGVIGPDRSPNRRHVIGYLRFEVSGYRISIVVVSHGTRATYLANINGVSDKCSFYAHLRRIRCLSMSCSLLFLNLSDSQLSLDGLFHVPVFENILIKDEHLALVQRIVGSEWNARQSNDLCWRSSRSLENSTLCAVGKDSPW